MCACQPHLTYMYKTCMVKSVHVLIVHSMYMYMKTTHVMLIQLYMYIHVKSPGCVIVKVHKHVWKLSESTAVNYYESPQQHQLTS